MAEQKDGAGSEPEQYEAIVVGSGFGGAVAACRLAQAGYRTVILERGRRYEKDDFPALPSDDVLLPDLGRWTWGHDQGLWDILDLEELIAVQAAGYGGGSLIYANVHLRAPDSVFQHPWPTAYQKGGLREHYNLVAHMLEPAPITTHDRHPFQKTRGLETAMTNLGRRDAFFHPPLVIQSKPGTNRHGRKMQDCDGCARCCSGCPREAKNTLDFNYLAVAEANDATVHTQCEVEDIVQQADGTWVVECIDHLGARHRSFRARSLFLCAGSVHSTRLLARAKLLGPSRAVQERVGVGYSPGGDSLGVVFDTRDPEEPNQGPTIASTTVHWQSKEDGRFFQIQDGGYSRELDRMIGMLRAPAWLGRNRVTAAVPASRDRERRRPEPVLRSTLSPSPLDGVLDAGADPNDCHDGKKTSVFDALVPTQLWKAVPRLLDELTKPMLLPAIVDRTIDDALRAANARCWLTKRCRPDGWPLRALRGIARWGIRKLLATDDQLAHFAIRRMASGAGLDRNEIAENVLGYESSHSRYRTMLLGMGRDAARGSLHYDRERDRIVAELDLYHLTPTYTQQEQLMADVAKELGGELRTSPAWAFLGKPITVHNQGGCPMSEDPTLGVTDPNGKVHGCEGLYVMDGSVMCTSVGVNPSATIAAIAERNIAVFMQDAARQPSVPSARGKQAYADQRKDSTDWDRSPEHASWALTPPTDTDDVRFVSKPVGLTFTEHMEGFYSETDVSPGEDDDAYRRYESNGRPTQSLSVTLEVSTPDLARFFEDEHHRLDLAGTALIVLPGATQATKAKVTGKLELFVPRYKEHAIRSEERRKAQAHFAGSYTAKAGPPPEAEERRMSYTLRLETLGLTLHGYKRIRNDPGLDAWRDVSALFCQIMKDNGSRHRQTPWGAGIIHIDMPGFLFDQLKSFQITGTADDDPRNVWALAKFAAFFYGSLQRIYMPDAGTALSTFFRLNAHGARR